VTAPQRRSVLSAISTIIREVVFKDPDSGASGDNETVVVPSPDPAPQLNSHRESQSEIQPYQKTRSETFVEGGDLSHRSPVESVPDDLLEYQTSGYDVIAHLPPSTIQPTINFSSHRGGIAALGKNQQAMASDPYEEEVDVRNESWQCIPVPHLPKSRAHKHRLPMYPILGSIIHCALMTTRYSGITLDTATSAAPAAAVPVLVGGPSSGSLSPSGGGSSAAPSDAPDSSSPLDSNSSISALSGDLSIETDRLVVLSSREDKDGGELRLFENLQLIAIIRLSSVTKVFPPPPSFLPCALISCLPQVVPSSTLLHIIEIHDVSGSIWFLHPGEVHPNQSTSGAKFWLALIAHSCPSRVHTTLICHEGYLGKRGQLNTAYKRRWFVLDSDQKVNPSSPSSCA
jgi:hypothetical protein